LLPQRSRSSLGASATTQELCETSKAGIKRCETNISNAAKNIPNMKSVVWTDRAHDIVNLEISFPVKMDAVWPAALIGGAMSTLAPNSTKEVRGRIIQASVRQRREGQFRLYSSRKLRMDFSGERRGDYDPGVASEALAR
jgi:hypothetical protein